MRHVFLRVLVANSVLRVLLTALKSPAFITVTCWCVDCANQIVEERTIGPTLGMQKYRARAKACIAGLLASILFMIIYYRKFGLIASSALLANLVLIVGVMSLLPGATLTMPGIAGLY